MCEKEEIDFLRNIGGVDRVYATMTSDFNDLTGIGRQSRDAGFVSDCNQFLSKNYANDFLVVFINNVGQEFGIRLKWFKVEKI